MDIILANDSLPPLHILAQYARTASEPVIIDSEKLSRYKLINTSLLIDYEKDHGYQELQRAS